MSHLTQILPRQLQGRVEDGSHCRSANYDSSDGIRSIGASDLCRYQAYWLYSCRTSSKSVAA